MEHRINAAPSLHRAVIRCRDSVFRRLLELELGLCGVTTVSEDEAYGLMLLDLDEYPRLPPLGGGYCVICWSRGDTAALKDVDLSGFDIVYLHRPFPLSELESCIYRSILPRDAETAVLPMPAFPFPTPPEERLKPRRFTKDILLLGNGLLSLDGKEISLTPREAALFSCLWKNRGKTVPKALLREALDAPQGEGASADNTPEVYICHLRRKLERPSGKRLITTVRGEGYRLENYDPT
ncbi:MAG: winged helix-turn-helix domain-containing protein [Clostridia bacterium]|nr:winged helix-turn-helix domain-containing protein [Clostridia bacterium]